MLPRPAPPSDPRRTYPVTLQIGLILSLSLAIAAFTVDLPESDRSVPPAPPVEIVTVVDVPITREPAPPPPPPPAPPPPQEVPDAQEVEDQIAEVVLDVFEDVPALPRPEPPSRPTPPPVLDPPPPPPPPPGTDAEPEPFVFAEVQPELVGGLAGLQSRVEYPELAQRAGIEGQVIVQFVVDAEGRVVDPVVLRSPNDLLAEAALKAVRESAFRPGLQRGRPVPVRFAVPVTFRLR